MQLPQTLFKNSTKTLALLLSLIFGSAILGESTAEALVLSHYGISWLPKLFLLNAFLLFGVSVITMLGIDRIDRGLLFKRIMYVHGLSLMVFWLALHCNCKPLYISLFSYAYSTKILTFTLFWTIANDLIDSRNASVQFPLIAAGGTLGAILISYLIPILTRFYNTEDLVLIWALLIISAAYYFNTIQKSYNHRLGCFDLDRSGSKKIRARLTDAYTGLLSEPIVRTFSVLYYLLFVLLFHQHYLFYKQIKTVFVTTEAIASFLGAFVGSSMLFTLFSQFTISGKIIRRIGSARSMILLPVLLFLVYGVQFLIMISGVNDKNQIAMFAAVVAGMAIRIVLFDSLFSPNFQLFFSSLGRNIRGRAKLLLEGVIKPIAIASTGGWLIFAEQYLSTKAQLSLCVLLAAIATAVSILLRRSYIASLTKTVRSRTGVALLTEEDVVDFSGSSAIHKIIDKLLTDGDSETQRMIIELLAKEESDDAVALLINHLDRFDNKALASCIVAFGTVKKDGLKETVIRYLDHQDSRVVANAIYALRYYLDSKTAALLNKFLYHSVNRIRANTLIVLWPRLVTFDKDVAYMLLAKMLDSDNENECASALFVISEIKEQQPLSLLTRLLQEKSHLLSASRKIRKHFLRAAGSIGGMGAIELLLITATVCGRKVKNSLVHEIAKVIKSGGLTKKVLSSIDSRTTYQKLLLTMSLKAADILLTKEQEKLLHALFTTEMSHYDTSKESITFFESYRRYPSIELLVFAIKEEIQDVTIELFLAISSQLDHRNQIKKVLPFIASSDLHVKAKAYEVLANCGNVKINNAILQVIDNKYNKMERMAIGSSGESRTLEQHLNELLHHENEWVVLCAANAFTSLKSMGLEMMETEWNREVEL